MTRRLLSPLIAVAAVVAAPAVAGAATFSPATGAALQAALTTAGANDADDTITLTGPASFSLTGGFEFLTAVSDQDNALTIEGGGRTITGAGATTTVLDLLNTGAGRVTVRDLTINGVATTTTVVDARAPTTLTGVTVGGIVAAGNTSGVRIAGDVDATNINVVVAAQQGVQADGGTSVIRRSTVRTATSRMINVSTATVTVEDSIIRDPSGAGGSGVEAGDPTSDVTVRRSRISGMSSGVVAGFGGTVVVEDSLITNPKPGGRAVLVNDSGNSTAFEGRATVARTTMVGTGQATQVAVLVTGGDGTEQDRMQATVRDSVVSGFATALRCQELNTQSINTITVERSVLPPGTTDSNTCADLFAPGITLSEVTRVEPQFADAAAGDYRPAAGSPLVDAGLDAAALPGLSATDLTGSPRLVDGNGDCVARLDLGAFELQVPAAPQCLPAAPAPPAPGAPPVTPDTTAPALSGVKVAKAIRRSGGATPPVTIRLRLSEAATLRLTFQRRRGKRYVAVKGAVALPLAAGAQRVRFAGRISRAQRLALGDYRITLTATDAAGNRSKAARALFRLTR